MNGKNAVLFTCMGVMFCVVLPLIILNYVDPIWVKQIDGRTQYVFTIFGMVGIVFFIFAGLSLITKSDTRSKQQKVKSVE